MARGDTRLEREVVLQEGQFISAILEGHPVQQFRSLFRNNINRATRIAKREMVDMVKTRISKGVQGAGYSEDYAKVKNEMPFTPNRTYTEGGPVDFNFSGQLMKSLDGRGRAKPTKNEFTIWIGFDPLNKRTSRPRRLGATPPGVENELSHRELAEILNGDAGPPNKWKIGTEGKPLQLLPDERDELIQRTASEIVRTGAN